MTGFNIRDYIPARNKQDTARWFPVEVAPDATNFRMKINHVSKRTLEKWGKACTKYVYSRAQKAKVPELNQEALFRKYAESVIEDWDGLTIGDLMTLIRLEVPEGTDLKQEVTCTQDNVVALLLNARAIDDWVTDIAVDPSNYVDRDEDEEEEAETEN